MCPCPMQRGWNQRIFRIPSRSHDSVVCSPCDNQHPNAECGCGFPCAVTAAQRAAPCLLTCGLCLMFNHNNNNNYHFWISNIFEYIFVTECCCISILPYNVPSPLAHVLPQVLKKSWCPGPSPVWCLWNTADGTASISNFISFFQVTQGNVAQDFHELWAQALKSV